MDQQFDGLISFTPRSIHWIRLDSGWIVWSGARSDDGRRGGCARTINKGHISFAGKEGSNIVVPNEVISGVQF